MSPYIHSDEALLQSFQSGFGETRYLTDTFEIETGFSGFWEDVYPTHKRLVLAYTTEAMAALGLHLQTMEAGTQLPSVEHIVLKKHYQMLGALYDVLEDGMLISHTQDNRFIRTSTPVDPTPSRDIYQSLVAAFPSHAAVHRLLHVVGPRLADGLTGVVDPLNLVFGENRFLLQEVYRDAPMFLKATKQLAAFLTRAYADASPSAPIQILEIGAGLGGTTKHIVELLASLQIPFTYTFSDISSSLVSAAKRTFSHLPEGMMKFTSLDVESAPPDHLKARFHTIISTNCVHATKDLKVSTSHILQMLRPGGFLSLIELTKRIYWFDLVFGFFEGWWLFNDGRSHALADLEFWKRSMEAAGFKDITWSEQKEEERLLSVITAFKSASAKDSITWFLNMIICNW